MTQLADYNIVVEVEVRDVLNGQWTSWDIGIVGRILPLYSMGTKLHLHVYIFPPTLCSVAI